MNFIDIRHSFEIDWWSPKVYHNEDGVVWRFFEFLKQNEEGINEGHTESHHVMVF